MLLCGRSAEKMQQAVRWSAQSLHSEEKLSYVSCAESAISSRCYGFRRCLKTVFLLCSEYSSLFATVQRVLENIVYSEHRRSLLTACGRGSWLSLTAWRPLSFRGHNFDRPISWNSLECLSQRILVDNIMQGDWALRHPCLKMDSARHPGRQATVAPSRFPYFTLKASMALSLISPRRLRKPGLAPLRITEAAYVKSFRISRHFVCCRRESRRPAHYEENTKPRVAQNRVHKESTQSIGRKHGSRFWDARPAFSPISPSPPSLLFSRHPVASCMPPRPTQRSDPGLRHPSRSPSARSKCVCVCRHWT